MAATGTAVFAAGSSDSANGDSLWIVRRTLDNGRTWTTVDSYQLEAGRAASANAIATDGANTIYVVGPSLKQIAPNTFENRWMVRKSTDNGETWTTVEERSNFRYPTSVAIDAAGAVYVSGSTQPGLSNNAWMTERSLDAGTTWTIVDTFTNNGNIAEAHSVVTTPSGSVFVGGSSFDSTSRLRWIVRQSNDGTPNSFTTVDSFQLEPAQFAVAQGGAADSNGNVVFVGLATSSDGSNHWITRKSPTGAPTFWTTIDDIVASTDSSAFGAYGVAFARRGELFVTGGTKVGDNYFYTTRRGTLAPGSFEDSDSVQGDIIPAYSGSTGGQRAVLYTSRGDFYTGGAISDTDNKVEWLVRKLSCQ